MSIEAIAALGAQSIVPEIASVTPVATGDFQPLLSALTRLNTDISAGEQGLRSLAVGDLDNLHQSMMNMEKVRLSMQLLLQVHSHALDAYQELMRMQV
jgi:flagellar hook-basal body complex protein FliE